MDTRSPKQHDSPSVVVESSAVRLGVASTDLAALVGRLTRCIHVAIWRVQCARHGASVRDRASIVRMESHIVGRLIIDAFNDV